MRRMTFRFLLAVPLLLAAALQACARQAHGVRIVGPVNLPASIPQHASQMFSRNVSTFVLRFLKDGAFAPDLSDEIAGPMCVTHGGQVRTRGN